MIVIDPRDRGCPRRFGICRFRKRDADDWSPLAKLNEACVHTDSTKSLFSQCNVFNPLSLLLQQRNRPCIEWISWQIAKSMLLENNNTAYANYVSAIFTPDDATESTWIVPLPPFKTRKTIDACGECTNAKRTILGHAAWWGWSYVSFSLCFTYGGLKSIVYQNVIDKSVRIFIRPRSHRAKKRKRIRKTIIIRMWAWVRSFGIYCFQRYKATINMTSHWQIQAYPTCSTSLKMNFQRPFRRGKENLHRLSWTICWRMPTLNVGSLAPSG